jgi:hypothetical protein
VSIGPAKIRCEAVLLGIRPNVQDEELCFLQATFRQHLQNVVLTLRVMQGVMIAHLPMHQFENPKV